MRFFEQLPKTKIRVYEGSYVTIHYWKKTQKNIIGHVSLEIFCNDSRKYISLYPRNFMESKSDLFPVLSFDEDCFVQGYRYENEKNINIEDILSRLNPWINNTLLPTQSIKLYSLNVQKILDANLEYEKTSCGQSSYFERSLYCQKNTHNNASFILFLLHEGGINKLFLSYSEKLASFLVCISGIISAGFVGLELKNSLVNAKGSITKNDLCIEVVLRIMSTILAVGLGTVVGSAVDGYYDIQPYLQILTNQKKNSFLKSACLNGGAIFVSAIHSLFLSPHFITRFLALPDHLIDIAQAASQVERKGGLDTYNRQIAGFQM